MVRRGPHRRDRIDLWYKCPIPRQVPHVNTSRTGIKSAFRYRDLYFEEKVKRKEKPYLAFYPMEDLSFLLGDEFRGIRVKSSLLPDTGIIYDLAEMDVRYSGLVHKTERKKPEAGAAKGLVVFGIEPGKDLSDQELEKWFKEEVKSPVR